MDKTISPQCIHLVILLFCVGCAEDGGVVGSAEAYLTNGSRIDAESASITPEVWMGNGLPCTTNADCSTRACVNAECGLYDGYHLLDNGYDFNAALKSMAWDRRTWISPSIWFGNNTGGHSIAYETSPVAGAPLTSMQKVMHEFDRSESEDRIPFAALRYLGFALWVHPDSDVPSKPTIVTQFWQGSPHSPPIAVELEGTGFGEELRLGFYGRNDCTGAFGGYGSGSTAPMVIGHVPLQRGHWHKFVIAVRFAYGEAQDPENPSYSPNPEECEAPNGTGLVRVWSADAGSFAPYAPGSDIDWNAPLQEVLYWQHRAPLGYRPTTQGGIPDAKDFITPHIGLYRRSQDTYMRVAFDQVRVTMTYAYANPSNW